MYKLTEGDTGQVEHTTLTAGGTVLDLAGATVVFHVKRPLDADPLIDGAGQVVDAALGVVTYDLQPADLPAGSAGRYLAQWLVTDAFGDTKAYGAGTDGWLPVSVAPRLVAAP